MGHVKQHWFAFSFKDNGNVTASTYIGFRTKLVTLAQIALAKESAAVSQNAVLLNVSYLGYMARETMMGPDNEESPH